jgi:hypothetical protein
VPNTFTVATPSGGSHRYFVAPPGVRLRNTQGHLCPHVDTRAGGGYVVGPGSVTEQGGYGLDDDTDPALLPAWLVQAIVEKPAAAFSAPVQIRSTDTGTYGAAALRGETRRVRDAAPGTYNEVLSSAAYIIGRKVGAGLIEYAIARADLIAAGKPWSVRRTGHPTSTKSSAWSKPDSQPVPATPSPAGRPRCLMGLTFTDIFCGAGGSSIGLTAAGLELTLAANHWQRAIETHAANFRDAEHLCADVNNYDMRRLPKTDVLWASPICTEISPAGGRKRRHTQGQLDLLDRDRSCKPGSSGPARRSTTSSAPPKSTTTAPSWWRTSPTSPTAGSCSTGGSPA